jgi:AcrR family transcriptional regulator
LKRKEMILSVSLDLFNRLGESNVSSVDIANEMEISPGNLYYHFRGKEEIIAALVLRFSSAIESVVGQRKTDGSAEFVSLWQPVYTLLEVIYIHRFFFRNIPDIRYRYPEAGKIVIKVLGQLQLAFQNNVVQLAEKEEIAISPVQKNLIAKLVHAMMMVIIYWESYQTLQQRFVAETEFIQDASLQLLSLLSPYLSDDQIRAIHQYHQQYLRDRITRPIQEGLDG